MERIEASDLAAVTALSRFGLGPRPGDIDRIRPDPRGAVLADLAEADVTLPAGEALATGPDAIATMRAAIRWRAGMIRHAADIDLLRSVSAPGEEVAPVPVSATLFALPEPGQAPEGPEPVDPSPGTTLLNGEVGARLAAAGAAPVGFVERLVQFWSNHFAISRLKGSDVIASVGPFEREAIRPHVRGQFSDMVRAVARHPAMLLYLDNVRSIGPQSPLGQRSGRGLNENLARELLELHTLGVDGGYSQADVTALARILTGWMLADAGRNGLRTGEFRFNAQAHEPGAQTVLGHVFPAGGVEQGEAAIAYITRHPATARHIARKLAAAFVADEPPPALVARLERVFLETDGNLAAVSRALVEAPESWAPVPAKVRPPQDFLIAAWRATGQTPTPAEFLYLANFLGQPLWSPSAPNGFSDAGDVWVTPMGVLDRMTAADYIARRSTGADPGQMLAATFASTVSSQSREAVLRAESRTQAVAILLMTPEFQWR